MIWRASKGTFLKELPHYTPHRGYRFSFFKVSQRKSHQRMLEIDHFSNDSLSTSLVENDSELMRLKSRHWYLSFLQVLSIYECLRAFASTYEHSRVLTNIYECLRELTSTARATCIYYKLVTFQFSKAIQIINSSQGQL